MKALKYFALGVVLFSTIIGNSQELPQDYLPSEFHKTRRDIVKKLLPQNSVAVFFANPVRNRANDVDYVYHQDPNFYYLTGYKEPHAVLVLFSEEQTDASGKKYDELIYVQKRDPRAEQWTGRRLGVKGVKQQLDFEHVYEGKDFANLTTDFPSFSTVLFSDFKNDVRDTRDEADLFDLIKQFKIKTNYPADYNATKQRLYRFIRNIKPEDLEEGRRFFNRYLRSAPDLRNDPLISDFLNADAEKFKKDIKEQVNLNLSVNNLDAQTLNEIMGSVRETKTAEEVKLIKKAVEISSVGQIEVMKAMHPYMSETAIQGVHEFVYKKYGAEYEGYPSIVGGGHNGCILHYIENNKPKVGEDLVLMDLGAEYHGYTADITRTIPANGKFSPEQRAIYQLVYEAQEAGIKASKVGASFSSPELAARSVINEGLIKLGIVKSTSEGRKYFPHGTSHYLGLDVHDPGTYGDFKENTIITVEPGIYIPEGSDCDEKWWGIAVRIEDDILITKDGPVNLSAMAPRSVEAIEAMMAKKSPLDDFKLPNLDEN